MTYEASDDDYFSREGDDDLRDYAEEAYNRDYCDHCGTTHDEGNHLADADDLAFAGHLA